MNIRWHLLGTGTAVPIGRGLPCNALKVNGDIYLFDTGEGCQERLFKAGLGVVKVRAIFISHLHGDHFFGLFGMIQSMHMLDRDKTLYIIAPDSLRQILITLQSKRIDSLGFNIEFIPIREGSVVYSDHHLSVKPFSVDHGVEAYGFSIEAKRRHAIRKIVYSGDTRPCNSVLEEARGADLLIHEATFTSHMRDEAYRQGHSTSLDAAIIAREARVKRLVLTHISSRYENGYELYIDAYRFFKNVIVGEDYMIVFP